MKTDFYILNIAVKVHLDKILNKIEDFLFNISL